MAEVQIDHAAVAGGGDAFARMTDDDRLDRLDGAAAEGFLVLVRVPVSVDHRLPAGVVRRLQFLDGDVLGAVLIPLGEPRFDAHIDALTSGDGAGSLLRPEQRARVHGIDAFGCEILSEMSGLTVSRFGELGVGNARFELPPDRQGMSDQQEFH